MAKIIGVFLTIAENNIEEQIDSTPKIIKYNFFLNIK